MKFSCSKEQLDKHLQFISRIITIRSTVPVLSNLLLETDGQILRISGTDMELAMTTHLPAQVEQEGTFTVPAKTFQEFVHQNPDETLSFQLESFDLVCSSPKVTGHIAGLDAEEFPPLPKLEKGVYFRLPLQSFVEAVKQVIIACASDHSRPVLTAVSFTLEGEEATLAATDSFRLAEKRIKVVPHAEKITALLPVRSLQELIRLAPSFITEEDLEVELGEQQIVFRLGDIELYSRLTTGAFPKYQSIIPKNAVAIADITTSEFMQALRLSAIFAQAGVANVMVEINEEGAFSVMSYGSQKGSSKHTIYAIVQEGFTPLKAAFNARFLLDAAQAAGTAGLQLRFSGMTTALIIATEDTNYLQLVMPIRLDG